MKKRKQFNTAEQRIIDEEQKQLLKQQLTQGELDPRALAKRNRRWKEKSQDFRNAIKHARAISKIFT